MGLLTLIVHYNDEGKLKDAINYIETNQSCFGVSDINEALKWAGKTPSNYKKRDEKIAELLNYLKYEYGK